MTKMLVLGRHFTNFGDEAMFTEAAESLDEVSLLA